MLYRCMGRRYTDFVSTLCEQRGVERYLEIGVQAGLNLAGIRVDYAIGIDPCFRLAVDPTIGKRQLLLARTTSDNFFKNNKIEDIDLAFLDGMHLFEYLLRDFSNTERSSSKKGIVLMHDCLPFEAGMVVRKDNLGAWTGNVWKIIPILKKYRPDLRVTLIDCEPTGLVAVSNLDPFCKTLDDNYHTIAQEFIESPNDERALEKLYAESKIESADFILDSFQQSLYFST